MTKRNAKRLIPGAWGPLCHSWPLWLALLIGGRPT